MILQCFCGKLQAPNYALSAAQAIANRPLKKVVWTDATLRGLARKPFINPTGLRANSEQSISFVPIQVNIGTFRPQYVLFICSRGPLGSELYLKLH